MKKFALLALSAILVMSLMAGCSNSGNNSSTSTDTGDSTQTQSDSTQQESSFDTSSNITVISREASSGTRSAFDELMQIIVEENGNTTDRLFPEAIIVNSTDEVASKVEVDPFAIGYTSLGSVNDSVKALSVDGVEATEDNVVAGTYKISRPFILATNKNASNPIADDFIKFITSAAGQQIVTDEGYIALTGDLPEYTAANLSGKVTLSGSTSVEKIMEKAREEYIKLNPNVDVEITYSGSGAGIKDGIASKVDIAMSSRELKEEELADLNPTVFAHDGIAVIVNKENPLNEITSDQITSIFIGETRTWADVIQ